MSDVNENTTVNKEEEISLLDLAAVLLARKFMIIGITVGAMVFAVLISIISLLLPPEKSFLPNKYSPKALMLINDPSSGGGGLSSALASSGLGGLASMAGVSVPGSSSYSELAIGYVHMNSFMDQIAQKFDFVNKYEITKLKKDSCREIIKKNASVSYDDKSGIFSFSYTDIDPKFAMEVVNYGVSLLEEFFTELGLDKNVLEKKNLEENIGTSYSEILKLQKKVMGLENSVSSGSGYVPAIMNDIAMLKIELSAQEQVYIQLKKQYELLKVQMASETPVFQIIEKAELVEKKSGPSRGKLCIIIAFAGFFISVFIAFLLNALQNIKQDEEAMRKLGFSK